MKGKLYVVATPIGNTEDITARARRILAEADIVAAEDTRTTSILFKILGIRNKTVSNHKFNEKLKVDYLISQLEEGKNVALVSDAGTPCISDPGGLIVSAAVKHDIEIVGVCGASSVITALSVCGFGFDTFSFYGFLPKTSGEIKKIISAARKSDIPAAVFFESPKRIKKTLGIFGEEVPDAALCLCNDLTKMYERIYRGTPKEILEELNENPQAEKGEYTLVVNPGAAPEITNDSAISSEAMVVDYIVKNRCSAKDAVNALAEKFKGTITKKELYSASLRVRSLFNEENN